MYQIGQLSEEEQTVEATLKSSVNNCFVPATVISKWGGVYEVTYTPEVRGRHTMTVKVNGTQIAGSPFQVYAKIHPTQLVEPVGVMEGVSEPWGLALNSKQQLVVAEDSSLGEVTVFGEDGKVQTMTCEKLSNPTGVAVDREDNIYVSDHWNHSVFKFNREGELMKVIEQKGTQPGEIQDPRAIKIINDKLYICDNGNNRFQVLNTELEYMHSFGNYGRGHGEFKWPNDIAQDGAGNLYVSDTLNNRVQVFNSEGQFLFEFFERGADSELCRPFGICVDSDQFVYVCDSWNQCVSVFDTSGEFVTSLGEIRHPRGIVIDDDGFVYVAEHTFNGRIHIF